MKIFENIFKNWKAYTKKTYLNEDSMPGGAADDMPDSKFDEKQLKIGIKHEMEHTKDADKAKQIAKDHLIEDPNYYTKIKKIEK